MNKGKNKAIRFDPWGTPNDAKKQIWFRHILHTFVCLIENSTTMILPHKIHLIPSNGYIHYRGKKIQFSKNRQIISTSFVFKVSADKIQSLNSSLEFKDRISPVAQFIKVLRYFVPNSFCLSTQKKNIMFK